MHPESLQKLFLAGRHDVHNVEQQISDALARLATGVSAQGLWRTLRRLLETTRHHGERLDRMLQEVGRARELTRTAWAAGTSVPSSYDLLTSREAEVLQLIAEGYANKQIAAELAISTKTVEKHRQHLMAKLDLHDTAGVTRYAIAAGVVAVGV